MAEIKTNNSIDKYLNDISKRFANKSVQVGFLEGATLPARDGDGGQVKYAAEIAAIQNYGAPAKGIPPRPFFGDMVAKQSPTWGADVEALLKAGNDSETTLNLMGARIADQLALSIRDTNDPPLSILTLMARKARRDGTTVTGKTIGELASERAKGPPNLGGISTKPLIDYGDMLRAIDFKVS